MNKKFTDRLNEYLESECSDFDMAFDYKWEEDTACCEVKIYRSDYTKLEKLINFRYNEKNDELEIELSEGSFYETREYDYSVKYFWMLVAPSLFPNN
jgi:hypothetical protein